MKTRFIMLLAAIVLLIWTCCEPPPKEGYCLTFKVDMSDVEIADTDTVGIRGNIAPLSWTDTYLMNGPDENGLYFVSIHFDSVKYGERLQYKYIISDTTWDNDRYGENGNRIATICCNEQDLPVDVWDKLDEFSLESLYVSGAWDVFMSWIYTLGKAKERGLSMEEAAQEIVDFWDWETDSEAKLEFFMLMDEFYQAKTPFGYFEIIEHTPDRVEYIKNKDWEIMMYMWDESGVVKGVSAQDMTDMFREMMNIYTSKNGFTMSWQDLDDYKVKITITSQ